MTAGPGSRTAAAAQREPSPGAGGTRRVLAAVDGSASSAAVLAWADAEARRRGAELLVVTVCGRGTPWPASAGDAGGGGPAGQACRDMQARLLSGLPSDRAAQRTGRIVAGDPVAEITSAAVGADVLVAGTRGNSPLRSLLLGSVAQGCAERASCPVVIVPAAARPARAAAPIVAGVDPSAGARAALRFAAEEATLRGARLVAVHAVYADYVRAERSGDREEPGDRDLLSPLDSAWAQLDALIRAEPAAAGLPVQPLAVSGDPARVLLDWSDSAALVVVGSRGAGRLHAALLGSVSGQLLRRGRCPIAVVPAPPG